MTTQRTIKDPVVIEGIGLQTGKKVKLTLKSSPVNSGINFIRVDLPDKPLLNIQSINFDAAIPSPERRTTLSMGPLQIQTTEHLLAALSGLGIDNIVAELDNIELPGLDGSAKDYVDGIKKSGIVEQPAEKKALKPTEPVWLKVRDSIIAVLPDEELRVSYALSYDDPAIGTQFLSIALNEKNFISEIAPARTFCLEKEAELLIKQGLGKGASYENTLVMGKEGPVKNKLRFPDEPVRHKILDLIGDLYLVGAPLVGHVVAVKSGHAVNMELVKKLKNIGR